MATKPKHIIEYIALRMVVGIVGILPRKAGLIFIWPLARLSYSLMGKRVKEARRRMKSVLGPDVSDMDTRRWSWVSWRNLVFNIVEIAHAPRMSNTRRQQLYVGIEMPVSRELNSSGTGFTIAVCHMGNWELCGVCVRSTGLPIFVMMRGQSNPLVTEYLNRRRDIFGIGAIERHSKALGSIIKRIRGGEIFTILPDIRAPKKETAVVAPYLGTDAYLNAGMALFAKHTKTPIVPIIVRRRGWFDHVMEEQEPIYPDDKLEKDEDIQRMTAEVMKVFEKAVRQTPEQYFWYNKRWVLDQRFD